MLVLVECPRQRAFQEVDFRPVFKDNTQSWIFPFGFARIFLDDAVHQTKQTIEDEDLTDFCIRFLYNPFLHHHFGGQYLVDVLKEFFVTEKVVTWLA